MKQTTLDYVPENPTSEAKEQAKVKAPASENKTDSTDLIAVEKLKPAEIFSVEKGLDPIIKKIKDQVEAETFDPSTEKGRTQIRSTARKIGSAKMRLKEMALKLTEEWRVQTKAVVTETSRMEKELNELRDKIMEPVEEYEARIEQRRQELEQRIASLSATAEFDDTPTSAAVQARIDKANSIYQYDWQEFQERATNIWEQVQPKLAKLIAERKKSEEEQAELKRLREEEDKRKQKEHEEKIASEAAAKAKKDAEEKAAAEKKKLEEDAERERRAKEASELREEENRLHAHRSMIERIQRLAEGTTIHSMSSQALEGRIAEITDILVSREWQEFAEEAKVVHQKTKTTLEGIIETAKQREAADKKRIEDAAAQKERERIAAEEKKKADEQKRREEDKAHRAKINNQALNALSAVLSGDNLLTAAAASKAVVEAIAKGEIPHTKIEY